MAGTNVLGIRKRGDAGVSPGIHGGEREGLLPRLCDTPIQLAAERKLVPYGDDGCWFCVCKGTKVDMGNHYLLWCHSESCKTWKATWSFWSALITAQTLGSSRNPNPWSSRNPSSQAPSDKNEILPHPNRGTGGTDDESRWRTSAEWAMALECAGPPVAESGGLRWRNPTQPGSQDPPSKGPLYHCRSNCC